MGLTFHYRGRLAGKDQIKPLVAEVTAICTEFGWKYTAIADAVLEGLSIMPENCEPLMLFFDGDARLIYPPIGGIELPANTWLFTKTQDAGPETHMALIRLLRYLEGKYFVELEVNDEGEFWETDDETVLRAQFERYNAALDWVTGALEEYYESNKKPVDLRDKLVNFLRKKNGEENL